ncbi:putative ubiquitin specific peptidase 11 protein [Phaeoacremonium minimum UCRPA7]|uniref:ubiquitinyl hydrolase 1 n=1 Tax=Phaeoacremonium minimum (strain UCR-PA7) TaxID=1286976 RepID=R8BFQ6_PHAM7|nr:putative ubiquitin specific peptidase 11 protein [Phaeoacremonium minimum UCRPA7]EON98122.1 putative ubiquitin specific peptidase 11 protein [Phaeoacremonium minimum UCRPA7]
MSSTTTVFNTFLKQIKQRSGISLDRKSLRSVEELTKYFLTHEAEKEINTDNPLAHNGDVARAYGHLLAEMYKDPAPPSIVPKFFRSTIGRYAPAFAGYGQQDSQEFLGFLLDGLQEDLSRIKKKPYIEKPDSTDDMINNLEAIREMAAKVWDITKKRDDSVVADLFTGMYKSTLVCPVCQKISITFDPFNNLTLPLPVQNTWSKTVKYYPLNDTPVEMAVELDKNSSIKSLKDFISARVGVPTERLFAAEEFRDKFFKIYQDFSTVSEQIGSSDLPTVHELEAAPTNTNPTKKTKKVRSMLSLDDEEDETPSWDNPMAERMVVPVLHRFNPNTSSGFRRRGGNNQSAVSPPHFIVLTPEEARDEDAIRRKVLEKVATFTNWPEFNRAEDSDTSENTDPEMSVTNASDIDSSGDGKVVAKSVEGEDDMVDVTMKDAHDNRQPTVQSNTTASASSLLPLKVFNSQRPKWVNPSEFLDASFQNLFELSFFHEQGSLIPSGWSGVQDGSLLPKLESRKPAPSTPTDQDMASPATWGNGTASEEDSSVEEASHTSATTVTRMNDESSEEDVEFPPFQDIPVRSGPAPRPRGKGGKKMKPRQLNHKGGRRKAKQMAKQNARQQQHHGYQASEPQDITPDDGPLVRLGEGIVVEWDESTWDTVYGRNPRDEDDTMRGMALFNNLETLHDPLLEAKKKERIQRKKTGISLNDCLDEFEKEEILSEQDMWYCPRCKERRRASKKFDLWKTPDILIVHLKRFSSSGWRRDKLEILVDFPIEGLDLTKRVIDKESGKEEIYDLIAVDNHWGGLGGGHYTAFAKSFVDSEWYEYNDSSVSKQKDPTRVVTNGAYLLFYRRRSDAPLGGPRFQEIVDRYDNNSATDEEMSESGEGADQPPSYQDVASAEDEEEEEENGILGMTNWDASDDKVHNSIEDEGIAMADWNTTNWNFDSLSRPRMGSEAEAENGYASDDAQHDSSGDEGGILANDNDRDAEMLLGEPASYQLPDQPEPEVSHYEEPPAPKLEAQAGLSEIRDQMWNRAVHNIPIQEDASSEKAVEIHLDDGAKN